MFITSRQGTPRLAVATAADLGAIRILVCSILLLGVLSENLAGTANLPSELRIPMGVMHNFAVIPGFEGILGNQKALLLLQICTVVSLILSTIGYRTRLVLPIAAFCYLVFGGILRQYTHFFHQGLVPFYILTILCFTPCGDALALDRV